MKSCEWILFYNETTGRVGYVPTGSRKALKINSKVYKVIFGRECDAETAARDIERKYGLHIKC